MTHSVQSCTASEFGAGTMPLIDKIKDIGMCATAWSLTSASE